MVKIGKLASTVTGVFFGVILMIYYVSLGKSATLTGLSSANEGAIVSFILSMGFAYIAYSAAEFKSKLIINIAYSLAIALFVYLLIANI